MIFMPEPFRHTSWIYLASLAGVSMLQGRPQSLTTLEGASAGLRSVKRGVCVVCVCVDWYGTGLTPRDSEVRATMQKYSAEGF